MRAARCCRTDVPSDAIGRVKDPSEGGSTCGVEARLLVEISQLGGEERRQGAEGALEAFRASLAELVRENPAAYGAGDDPQSQGRVVSQLIESVSSSFLQRTVEALRHKAGYVLVWGRWVHRAAFTFTGFGVLAAATLPLCAVSVMSTSAWGWVPGVVGVAAALLIGAWILSRIGGRGTWME